jgi:hypothetical protein
VNRNYGEDRDEAPESMPPSSPIDAEFIRISARPAVGPCERVVAFDEGLEVEIPQVVARKLTTERMPRTGSRRWQVSCRYNVGAATVGL